MRFVAAIVVPVIAFRALVFTTEGVIVAVVVVIVLSLELAMPMIELGVIPIIMAVSVAVLLDAVVLFVVEEGGGGIKTFRAAPVL